jgi:hypothetical protein
LYRGNGGEGEEKGEEGFICDGVQIDDEKVPCFTLNLSPTVMNYSVPKLHLHHHS